MKSKIIKKLIMSGLCMTLCFGLIQTNVMAVETKSGQESIDAKLVRIHDGKNTRQDVIISEADKEAALSNKLSSEKIIAKYGSKGNTNPSKLLTTVSTTTTPASIRLDATSSATGRNSLDDSFYFLDDSSLYGGDQSLLSASLGNATGCGPIAGCNILAYHAKYYGRSSLYPYNWVKSDWKKFQDDMFDINGGVQTLTRFNSMARYYTATHGYSYDDDYQSYYLNTDENLTDLCNFIKEQIDNNNPVAMLLGTNTSGSSYKTDFAMHWVTITGYTFWGDEADPYVKVSSWGDYYNLDLAELLANRTWIDVDYLYRK